MAAAILHEPKLLLLDEPTSGIDPQSRILIWNEIQRLVKEGMTILLSTQHMDEAERCHQLAFMAMGKILTYGSTNEVINEAGIHTWRITGDHLSSIVQQLSSYPDIIQVIEKGYEIRISAFEEDLLQNIDHELLETYKFKKTRTTLEDVFIFYIQREGTMV